MKRKERRKKKSEKEQSPIEEIQMDSGKGDKTTKEKE
jgi:hypothetical protein